MKTTTRSLFALAAVLAALAPAARAGRYLDHPVNINESQQSASGSLYDARHSADNLQFIGCSLKVNLNDPDPAIEVSCVARDARERVLNCSSTDERLVKVGQAMSGDAWIFFACDGTKLKALSVDHSSLFLP